MDKRLGEALYKEAISKRVIIYKIILNVITYNRNKI